MLTREEFIKKYYVDAAKATQGSGIYPETLLSMAIVESQGQVNGKYYPGMNASARYANNYFGIKDSADWKGKTIKLSTPNDAQPISTFRVYSNIGDSFKDFVKFLKVNPRYKKAGVFDSANYAEQIINIARAGYAENPNYATVITSVANKISKVIEKNIMKPIMNNKGAAGIALAFFFLLCIN